MIENYRLPLQLPVAKKRENAKNALYKIYIFVLLLFLKHHDSSLFVHTMSS